MFRTSIQKEDWNIDVLCRLQFLCNLKEQTISPVRQKLGTRCHCVPYYRTVLRVTIHVWVVVVTGKMKTSSIPTAITL